MAGVPMLLGWSFPEKKDVEHGAEEPERYSLDGHVVDRLPLLYMQICSAQGCIELAGKEEPSPCKNDHGINPSLGHAHSRKIVSIMQRTAQVILTQSHPFHQLSRFVREGRLVAGPLRRRVGPDPFERRRSQAIAISSSTGSISFAPTCASSPRSMHLR